ncbi:uncharacterized protein DDB_G0290685-like [Mya arenaria]|uniref:uncharacterized protein DDB_G0290685-like n=1 Tax=Mya arenaria TaxID=6604 RepID=UPI0022E820FB|nr:uncharacterized protein DDB_G0290685-like [Mya arenaria]
MSSKYQKRKERENRSKDVLQLLCGFTFITTCTGVHLRNVISDASSRHRFEPPKPSLPDRKGNDLKASTTHIETKGTNSDKDAAIALPLVEARESDAQGHDVEKEHLQHHVVNDEPNGDIHSKTNELALHGKLNTGAETGTVDSTGEREKKAPGTNHENTADETENKGSGTNGETIGETEPEQVTQDETPEGKPRPKPFKKVEMNGYVYYYYEDGAFDQSDVIDGTAVSDDQYYWDEASETTPEGSSTEAGKSEEQKTHPLVDGESVSHQQLGISGTDDHVDLANTEADTEHNDMNGNIHATRTTQSNTDGITQTTHENVNNKAHVESKSENISQQENHDTVNDNKHQNIRSIDESKHITINEHSPGTINNPGQNDFQHVDTSIKNDPEDTQPNHATGQTFAQLGINNQGNGNSNSVDNNNDFSQAVDTSHVDNNIPTHGGTQFLGNKNNDFSHVVDTSDADKDSPSHGDTQFLGNKNTLKEPDQNTETHR